MKDYYSILMVHPKAESFVIDSAYKRLAREYHPDLSKAADKHEKMIEINQAYEVLSDPIRRAAFDSEYFTRNSEPSGNGYYKADGPDQTHTTSAADESIDTLIRKAHGLMRGNNFPPAISLLKRAFDMNPYDRRVEMMLKDAKRTWGQMLLRNQH